MKHSAPGTMGTGDLALGCSLSAREQLQPPMEMALVRREDKCKATSISTYYSLPTTNGHAFMSSFEAHGEVFLFPCKREIAVELLSLRKTDSPENTVGVFKLFPATV